MQFYTTPHATWKHCNITSTAVLYLLSHYVLYSITRNCIKNCWTYAACYKWLATPWQPKTDEPSKQTSNSHTCIWQQLSRIGADVTSVSGRRWCFYMHRMSIFCSKYSSATDQFWGKQQHILIFFFCIKVHVAASRGIYPQVDKVSGLRSPLRHQSAQKPYDILQHERIPNNFLRLTILKESKDCHPVLKIILCSLFRKGQ